MVQFKSILVKENQLVLFDFNLVNFNRLGSELTELTADQICWLWPYHQLSICFQLLEGRYDSIFCYDFDLVYIWATVICRHHFPIAKVSVIPVIFYVV